MKNFRVAAGAVAIGLVTLFIAPAVANDWDQWRGPNRDGVINNFSLPNNLQETSLKQVWKQPLQPSYSGPIIVGNQVFVTETRDQSKEVVTSFNLKTGSTEWSTEWVGAMKVPFFAAANGSWIRSTPAYSDGVLFVAGMKDVLVAIDASMGTQVWKRDFPAENGTPVPSFGFVCSPLVDGNDLYVQAAGGLVKLDKKTGKTQWIALNDGGGMSGSAFSSPIISEVGGTRQLVVQTRTELCGVDIKTGRKLWGIPVTAYRGMNILTPTVFDDSIFTSTYGGTTQLISLTKQSSGSEQMAASTKWSLPVEGYMSSPVIVDGHAYVHLRNKRFACFDLKNGKETWRTKPFGKYASMVAVGDKVIALDERGDLLLIKANPSSFELMDKRKVGTDSWAHLAVTPTHLAVRNIDNVVVFQWNK